jgi:predicted amidohydrolase
MRWTLVLLCAPLLAQSPNLTPNPEFRLGPDREPVSWKRWSPYPGLQPAAEVVSGSGGSVLRLASHDFSSFGKWLSSAVPVQAGHFYRFEVLYRPDGIVNERESIGVMLSWNSAPGQPVQRDYVDRISPAGNGWRRASRTLQATERVSAAVIELWLRGTAYGSVSFRDPTFVEVPRPSVRKVRVVTTKINTHEATVDGNLKQMSEVLDRAGRERPDIILLTEAFVSRGVPGKAPELAQPLPGPATEVLAEKARKYKSYIIAGLLESDAGRTYNTAVLVDREGRLAGKYRKTHLPLAEVEDGITPGSDYPVFDTDFGRIGILICWDFVFPETARILRLKGSEVVFLPIAGDPIPGHWDTVTRARAMDNGIFLVTSMSQGLGSRIVNPEGEVLAEATEGLATADLDLDKESRVWWLSVGPADGEAKSLFIQERRPETYTPLIKEQD